MIQDIINGKMDAELDAIASAIRARRDILEKQKMFQFKPGDRVIFNRLTRPKYLVGQKATVQYLNRETVVVTIDDTAGLVKYRGQIKTSANLIDKLP